MNILGINFSPEKLQFSVMLLLIIGVLLYIRFLRKYRKSKQVQEPQKMTQDHMSDTEVER